jgi:hypothetical protein
MSQKVYRQGDLAFIPVTDIPKDAKAANTRVIRTGENGGVHALEEKSSAVMYEMNGVRYILSEDGVGIVHGEHKKVDLPAGKYEIRVQRELGQEGVRDVID